MKIIEDYQPKNELEKVDQQSMLMMIEKFENLLTRDNPICHFTASSWIVNQTRDKVLMIYHKIYQSWSWTGGHVDGERDFLKVALKEAKEETGVNVKPISEDIASLDILTVLSHEKRGKQIGAHLHLNVTYLCEADENALLTLNEEETSGVKWINMDEIDHYVSREDHEMLKVYHKLNDLVKELTNGKD